MRICVLGNSHVAALKIGWGNLKADYPGVDLVFFAERGGGLCTLQVEGRSLVPANSSLAQTIAYTSGGARQIDVDEYDLFLIYGMGRSLPRLDRRLSSAVVEVTLHATVAGALNIATARKLRSITDDKPIWLGPHPQSARFGVHGPFSSHFSYEEILTMIKARIEVVGVVLFPQPAETLANGWNTREEFSGGSRRLDIGDRISDELHEGGDGDHMNGDYGRIYLKHLLREVAGEGGASIPKSPTENSMRRMMR